VLPTHLRRLSAARNIFIQIFKYSDKMLFIIKMLKADESIFLGGGEVDVKPAFGLLAAVKIDFFFFSRGGGTTKLPNLFCEGHFLTTKLIICSTFFQTFEM
jgi:hypothetical protein